MNDEQGVSEYEAIRVGNEYRFVSWGGDAFAVDPASGQGRYLFSLDTPTYGPDGYLATFQVTETGVYALKDRRSDRVVTLSYRPWEGGEWRDIFTTRDLAYYLNEGYISGALTFSPSRCARLGRRCAVTLSVCPGFAAGWDVTRWDEAGAASASCPRLWGGRGRALAA